MKINIKLLLFYIIKEIIAFVLFIPGLIFLKRKFSNNNILFVLNYHNFSKYNNFKTKRGSVLETSYSKSFKRQIRFFKKYFNFYYPEDFFEGEPKKGLSILITFDDGYKDNYNIAAKILKENKIPTIFFVTTKYINSDNYIMHDMIKYLVEKNIISKDYLKLLDELNNEVNYKKEDVEKITDLFKRNNPNHRLMLDNEEVKDLYENGFKIGNHTYDHEGLTFLTKEKQFESIKNANDDLIKITGVKPNHFAYPNGFFNHKTLEILDELDLKYGYTIIGGYNTKNDSKKSLKRIGINVSDSKNFVLLKLLVYSTYKLGKV